MDRRGCGSVDPAHSGGRSCFTASNTRDNRGSEPNQQNPAQCSKDAALKEFQRRLDEYIELRSELAKKVEPLSIDGERLRARRPSGSAGRRPPTARAGAKRGDLIPTPVAEADSNDRRRRLQSPERRRAAGRCRGGARGTDSWPSTGPIRQQAALPTVPPLLLSKLPVLPDNLQYRFVDRHMVILDGDTQMIVDYIADVLPAR